MADAAATLSKVECCCLCRCQLSKPQAVIGAHAAAASLPAAAALLLLLHHSRKHAATVSQLLTGCHIAAAAASVLMRYHCRHLPVRVPQVPSLGVSVQLYCQLTAANKHTTHVAPPSLLLLLAPYS
jgi:hypothetical protein